MSDKVTDILLGQDRVAAQRSGNIRQEEEAKGAEQRIAARQILPPDQTYRPPERTFEYGTGEYFAEGFRAGVEQVGASFDGMAAIGNLLVGDEESARKNLQAMQVHDQRMEEALAQLDPFEDFLNDPTLQGGFNQAARAAGQLITPAALTIGEALATGFTATAARTAFTAMGRAALKDVFSKTIKKVGGLRADRTLKPEEPNMNAFFDGALWQNKYTPPPSVFEELWFKTLRNKGIDNLNPQEKVVMDVARKYLREAKIGGAVGAFAAAETMIAPEILREYQEAGVELGPTEALMATLAGVPAAAIDVASEAFFFGSLFKLATQSTRLAKTKARLARKGKLSQADRRALAIDAKAQKEGKDSLTRIEKEFLRRYENKAALVLLGDIGKITIASSLAESATEGLQEEIIMGQRALMDRSFDLQSEEANLRRMQAYFDGAVGGAGRSAVGGTSAAIFRKARDTLRQLRDDKNWAKIQAEKYRNLEEMGLPETDEDIQAQFRTMIDPQFRRRAVYIPTETLRASNLLTTYSEEVDVRRRSLPLINPQVTDTEALNLDALREYLDTAYRGYSNIPKMKMAVDPDGFGILLTVDDELRKWFENQRYNDVNIRDVLKEILNFEVEAEPGDGLSGDEAVVQLTLDGNVIYEQTTPTSRLEEVVKNAENEYKGDQKIINSPNKGKGPQQLRLPGIGAAVGDTPERTLSVVEKQEEAVLQRLEQAIIDDDLGAVEKEAAILKQLQKEKKDLRIVIKTPEEVAEERLEARREDDSGPIARDMEMDGFGDNEEINKNLNDTTKKYGTTPVGKAAQEDATLAFQLTNLLAMGRTENEIVRGKNGAWSYKSLPFEGYKDLKPEAQKKLRLERARAVSLILQTEMLLNNTFANKQDQDTLATYNEQLILFTEKIEQTSKELQDLKRSKTAIALKGLQNTLVTNTKDFAKLTPEKKLELTRKAYTETGRTVLSLDMYLTLLRNKKNHIKNLQEQRDNTSALLTEFAKTAEQSTTKTKRLKVTQNVVEQALLGTTPEAISQEYLGKGSDPVAFTELLMAINENVEGRLLVTPDGEALSDVEIQELKELIRKQEAVLLERDLEKISAKQSRREAKRKKGLRKQTDLPITQKENISYDIEKRLEALIEADDEEVIANRRKEALEIIATNYLLNGFTFGQLGYNRSLEIRGSLGPLVDESSFSLYDPEIYRANTAILKNLIEAQQEDPNSIYEIVPATAVEVEADPNNILFPGTSEQSPNLSAEDAAERLKNDKKFQDINLSLVASYINVLRKYGIVQGQRVVIALEGIKSEFGPSETNDLITFVEKLAEGDPSINISDDYQSIVKKITPESAEPIFNNKFKDSTTGKPMSPIAAVQTAVTSAEQIIFNRGINDKEFLESNEYKNFPNNQPLLYGWYKRTYNKKGKVKDIPLAMNEILSAGVAIVDTRIDSLERKAVDYKFKLAAGFGHLLSDKHLIGFEDKNGKDAEIVFKYRTYNKKDKGYSPEQSIVLTSIDQKIEDPVLRSHLKPTNKLTRFRPEVFKKYVTHPDYFFARDKKRDQFNKGRITKSRDEKGRLVEDPDRDFNLFNLPIYYDTVAQPGSLKTHMSALDLMEESQRTPFNYSVDESGNVISRKAKKINIYDEIEAKKKVLIDPEPSDIADKDSKSPGEIEATLRGYGNREEVEQRVRELYFDSFKLPNQKDHLDLVKAFAEENLNFDDLVLTDVFTGLQEGVDYTAFKIAQNLGYNVVGLVPHLKRFGKEGKKKGKFIKTESVGLFGGVDALIGLPPETLVGPVDPERDAAGAPLEGPIRLTEQRREIINILKENAVVGEDTTDTVEIRKPQVAYRNLKRLSAIEKEMKGRGVNVMRKPGTDQHYGNPFTHLKKRTAAAIPVKSLDEAVQSYSDWLLGKKHKDVMPKQREWIQEQIRSGALDGKVLLYYDKGSKQKNHAKVLADFVQKSQKRRSKKPQRKRAKRRPRISVGAVDENLINPESYPARTEVLTRTADAVIAFAEPDSKTGKLTPGTELTRDLADRYGKPFLLNPKSSLDILNFVIKNKVKRVMIAGSGLDNNLIKKTRYDNLLHEALSQIKSFKGKSTRPKEARTKFLSSLYDSPNPEKFAYPSPELESEILDTMILEYGLMMPDKHTYTTYINDRLGVDPVKVDQFGAELFDSDELDSLGRLAHESKQLSKGGPSIKEAIANNQNINGETVSGPVSLNGPAGVFIQDKVNKYFQALERRTLEEPEGTGEDIGQQLLDLRRMKRSEMTNLQKETLRQIQDKTKKVFPDAEDLYETRKQLSQVLQYDSITAGQLADPIKDITEVVQRKLGLKDRRIFVMFEDNIIKTDDPELNTFIQDQLFNETSRTHTRPDGSKVELTWTEDFHRAEKFITYKGVDFIVLKKPEKLKKLFDDEVLHDSYKNKVSPELFESEGMVLVGLLHGYGHSFYYQHINEKTLQTEDGKALYEEWKKASASDDPVVPTQWKGDHGFEEFIADTGGLFTIKGLSDMTKSKYQRRFKFTRDLLKKYTEALRTSKFQTARALGIRITTLPPKEAVKYMKDIAEAFKGTQRDRGGGLTKTLELEYDLVDNLKQLRFAGITNDEPIARDMELNDLFDRIDSYTGKPGTSKQNANKVWDRFLYAVAASSDYLRTLGVDGNFVDMLNRDVGSATQLGFIQAEVDEYNRILNSLFKPLTDALDIPIGTWGDDTELASEHRAKMAIEFRKFAGAIKYFGRAELKKQLDDPNYKTTYQDKDGTERTYRASPAVLSIANVQNKIKRYMELAGLETRENHDLSREYDIDGISNNEAKFNRMADLLEKANVTLTPAQAIKTVEKMIENRELNPDIIIDEEELSPFISSLAIGMSPARADLFENISTIDLLDAGLITDLLTSQIHSIRSIVKKYMYNNKVRKTLSDAEILLARQITARPQYKTPVGSLIDDTSFLEWAAEKETRLEQAERIKKLPVKDKETNLINESIYDLRGWQAATAHIWLNPNVKDPVKATNVVGAITGKVGIEINSMPLLRQTQSAAMLWNQVTFLTFSGLSTLPELIGPAIQRGDFEGLLLNAEAIGKNLKNKEEINDFLYVLGTLGVSQNLEASVYAGDMAWATQSTQEWSKFFFKSIGVTKLMQFIYRNAAFVSYKAIELDTKRALEGDAKSIERLADIGLTPNTAKKALAEVDFLNPNQKKDFVDYETRLKATPEARVLRASLQKLIKEMVLKPTSAQRTVWMNNPFFALIAQLKPFYYSFGKNYIGGTINNMKREAKYGNYLGAALPPMIMIAGMLPLAAIGLHLREFFKFVLNGGDPEQFRSFDMTTPEYMADLTDRAGLLGRYGLLVPMFEAEMYGSTFFSPLFGPTAERAIDIIEGRGNIWDYVPYFGAAGYD